MQARIQAQCEIGIIGVIKLSGLRLAATIAELWRGGRGGKGEVESREEEGESRGQARRRTQLEPRTEIRSTAPPGADPSRSDGK